MTSIYKLAKKVAESRRNQEVYRRISQLEKNILYEIYKVEPSTHEEYGTGWRAYIKDGDQKRYFIQLPKALTKEMKQSHIDGLRSDIANHRPAYFVYLNQDVNDGYEVDILPFGLRNENLFRNKISYIPTEDHEEEEIEKEIEEEPLPKKAKRSKAI